MITLYTRAARHLAHSIGLPHTAYTCSQFSDGELYLKLEMDLAGKDVLIISSTQAPAQNMLELFFLLKAVSDSKPRSINLLFSYFGYARQAIALHGEAASTAFICDTLKQFHGNKTIILHAHALQQLSALMNFTNAIDIDFFCTAARDYDIIAAPDQGAAHFAQEIAKQCNREMIFLRKTRPEQETVSIESVEGNVRNKKILLVDDIIATGNTLIEAARKLKQLGALRIAAVATHGIFAGNAHARFRESDIEKIFVTNSLPQTPSPLTQVYDVGPFLAKIIAMQMRMK